MLPYSNNIFLSKKKMSWLILTFFSFHSFSQQKSNFTPLPQTVMISEQSPPEEIIHKAANVGPTANQFEALKNEFIAFVHFGPNSFTRKEWGNGMEDPRIFDLRELHTDQWCQAMKSAGMKMVILTAKHHDGFVLWQSRYTKHGIMSTPYKNGKGDILKELSASCKKYGLKLGIYLSPADLYQMESPQGLYGNLSKTTMRTIPRNIEGRPFKNRTTFQVEADDYNEYFMNQLFELLTEYGPMHEVWFDGAHPKRKGGQQYNYQAWKKVIHALAPKAVIFGREDIRWCGNESGITRNTEWNVIPFAENPHEKNRFEDLTDEALGEQEQLIKGKYLHYQPAETNTSIREGWFYRDDVFQKVRSTDDVFDIYERSVGGNSIFLLNIPSNREGKFSPQDVNVLNETGIRIKNAYGNNLFKNAKGPFQVLDNDDNSFLVLKPGQSEILITTAIPVTINRLMLQEAIRTHGERVELHSVDAWINNEWKEIAKGTNIGYKRILRFPTVTASRFRFHFPKSRHTPAISHLAAFYYNTQPPTLMLTRSLAGEVTIEPNKPSFNWNPHGQNTIQNLYPPYNIYYTTDGSAPTEKSMRYDGPILARPGTIKAVAISGKQAGAVCSKQFGILKQKWSVLESGNSHPKHKGDQCFDEKSDTYWQSDSLASSRFIAIDLGEKHVLKGFAYSPQQESSDGMMQKGEIEISEDAKNWKTIETFEFGNLVNDPSERYHNFKQPVSIRYVKIKALEIAGSGKTLAIAELDFFAN
jgi:alpha-L-fucosidase